MVRYPPAFYFRFLNYFFFHMTRKHFFFVGMFPSCESFSQTRYRICVAMPSRPHWTPTIAATTCCAAWDGNPARAWGAMNEACAPLPPSSSPFSSVSPPPTLSRASSILFGAASKFSFCELVCKPPEAAAVDNRSEWGCYRPIRYNLGTDALMLCLICGGVGQACWRLYLRGMPRTTRVASGFING